MKGMHPSGRPIQRQIERRLSILRDPGVGPLISRLRQPEPKDAIGFHHHVIDETEYYELSHP